MRLSFNHVAALATAAAFVSVVSLPASAECKRYGFTVNDYGKDGPTKDAKSLLDKLIASKMTEQGVKDFHAGKKTVACELFLNFIVFDEHTCTAEATVCWGGTPLPKSEDAAADTDATTKAASDETTTPKPSKKKKKDIASTDLAVSESKSAALKIADPKPAPVHKAEVKAEEKKEAAEPAASGVAPADAVTAATKPEAPAPAETAAAKPAATMTKPVETGSLTETAKKPVKHKAEKAATESASDNSDKPAATDAAGYPTPLPPQPGDIPPQ